MPHNTILLTATINPPSGVPALVRTDPALRLQDYYKSFPMHLELLNQGADRLLFVENSASDLSRFEEMAKEAGKADRVEFISFNGCDYPPEYGRAHGEVKLINHACDTSRFLADWDDDRVVIWKITGRYVVKNMPEIMRRQPKSFDLYCNLRTIPIPYADMFLMAWRRRGYDEFLKGLQSQLREDLYKGPLERKFKELVDDVRTRLNVVPRFNRTPRLMGVRAFNNQPYDRTLKEECKYAFRVAMGRFLPWIWT